MIEPPTSPENISDLFEVEPTSDRHLELAQERQQSLTKPPESLGRLEDIACQIAAIQHTVAPKVSKRYVVVAAADHGIAVDGVSAYPQSVTAQMVANFLAGGAAVNALADQARAEVRIIDAGVSNPIPGDLTNLIDYKIANGTENFSTGPAMSHDQAAQIIQRGIEFAHQLCESEGCLVAVGEMGIGNTTSASAITAVMLDQPPKLVTGHGTGIDEVTRLRKAYLVSQAIKVNAPNREHPVDVLAKVGGYEIGFLAGVIIGAAKVRSAVIIDGFISTSAALLANALSPNTKNYMVASHQSVEPGHILALEHMGLKPIIDLDMRLGEASGAVLAMPIVEAAIEAHNGMATFEEASVSGPETQSAQASLDSESNLV